MTAGRTCRATSGSSPWSDTRAAMRVHARPEAHETRVDGIEAHPEVGLVSTSARRPSAPSPRLGIVVAVTGLTDH